MPSYSSLAVSAAALWAAPSLSAITSGEYAIDASDYTPQIWLHFNATGSRALPGPNIAQDKFGESTPSLEWNLQIGVHADMPVHGEEGQYFTGTQIILMPPSELTSNGTGINTTVRNTEPIWGYCFGVPMAIDTNAGDDVDGSCEGHLPDECIEALNTVVDADTGCVDFVNMPEECGDRDRLITGVSTSGNMSTNGWGMWYRRDDGETHELGNTTAYDEAIRRVYVVLTAFREDREDEDDDEFESGFAPSPKVYGNVSCIRPSEFSSESRDFEEGAASSLTVTMWSTITLGMTVLFILL